jgi:quinolinate synthase
MESLLEGRVMNEITVPDDIRRDALVALDRMLSLR